MYQRDVRWQTTYYHGGINWHVVSRVGGLRKKEPLDLKHNFHQEKIWKYLRNGSVHYRNSRGQLHIILSFYYLCIYFKFLFLLFIISYIILLFILYILSFISVITFCLFFVQIYVLFSVISRFYHVYDAWQSEMHCLGSEEPDILNQSLSEIPINVNQIYL